MSRALDYLEAPERRSDAATRREQRILDLDYEDGREQDANEHAARLVEEEGKGGFWREAWNFVRETPQAALYGLSAAGDETSETAQSLWASAQAGLEERRTGEPVEPRDVPDVTFWRDLTGASMPDTSGGQAAAALWQFAGGALFTAPAGGPAGTLAKAGAKMLPKVKGLLEGTGAASRGARGATDLGALSFTSAFAAHDAQEKRLLVVMNEVPWLADYVPDFLAAHDPDAPEWEQRFWRGVEEMAVGGAIGASLAAGGPVVAGAGVASAKGLWAAFYQQLKRYAHGHRQGEPGRVLDGPGKAQVKEAQTEDALAAQEKAEEALLSDPPEKTTAPDQLPSAADYRKALERGNKAPKVVERVSANYEWAIANDPAVAAKMAKDAGFKPPKPKEKEAVVEAVDLADLPSRDDYRDAIARKFLGHGDAAEKAADEFEALKATDPAAAARKARTAGLMLGARAADEPAKRVAPSVEEGEGAVVADDAAVDDLDVVDVGEAPAPGDPSPPSPLKGGGRGRSRGARRHLSQEEKRPPQEKLSPRRRKPSPRWVTRASSSPTPARRRTRSPTCSTSWPIRSSRAPPG